MKIGVTYTGSVQKHDNYDRWLREEQEVEVICLQYGRSKVTDIERCDGLLLSGGRDIHPELYGGITSYANSPVDGWDRDRDLFELALFQQALSSQIPVLGICRGFQLINIARKGTLIQDLGLAGNETHRATPSDKTHHLHIEPNTILHHTVIIDKGEINSAHHQAIDVLGEGLKISCRAEDGIIEGLEWHDPGAQAFLLGVQWHPERMVNCQLQDSPLSRSIRFRFLAEVKQRRPKHEYH